LNPRQLIDKVSYVRQHQLENVCSALSQRLQKRLVDCISIIRPPESVLSILSIDLAYMTSRHGRWADTEIFSEIYIDYLCSEFSLERSFAEIAHDEACILVGAGDSNQISAEDRGEYFLRYIVLLTMAHQDSTTLCDSLGFGNSFFVKLAKALDLSEKDTETSTVWQFPDQISQRIIEQVHRISRQMQLGMWSLACELLRLVIYDYNRSLQFVPTSRYASIALNALESLSDMKRPASEAEPKDPWQAALIDQTIISDEDGELMGQMWKPLVQSQLIFQVGNRRRGNQSLYALTDSGEWILALVQSCKWIEENDISLESIIELPKHLQIEVIRALPRQHVPMLIRLLTEAVNRTQPGALIAAIDQLAKFADAEKLAALVEVSLKLCTSPWSRTSICRAMSRIRAPKIGQILKDLADSDDSMAVRDAALGALLALPGQA
jgi:hypothetical protein